MFGFELLLHGRRMYGPGATGVGRCDEVRVVRHVWVAADLVVVLYGPNGREAVIDPSHRVRDFPPGQSLVAANGAVGCRRTRALLGAHHLARRRRTADRENLIPRVVAVEPIEACGFRCVVPEVLEAFQRGLIEGP